MEKDGTLTFPKTNKSKKKKKTHEAATVGIRLKRKPIPYNIYIDVFPLMWRERENKKTKANKKKKEIEETFLEIK